MPVVEDANTLLSQLTFGKSFAIPPVNLNDPLLLIPGDITSEIYKAIKPVTVEQLTTRQVGGSGVFDALMQSTSNHLKEEYEKNRITGAEYAKAYIALTQAALGAAVQFTLGKDQAFWQAQQAQIAAITARVQLEAMKLQLVKAQYEALLIEVQYATGKLNLANASVQWETARYQLDVMLPQQKVLLREQANAALAQTHDFREDLVPVTGVLGRQKDLYARQIISYERDSEVKVAKMFLDAFSVMKTMDEGLAPPSVFTNATFDTVFANLKARVNLAS